MPTIEGSMRYEKGRIAVIVSRFNTSITDQLQKGALKELELLGTPTQQIDLIKVPGAFELPIVAKIAMESGRYHGILALGAVIRGGTPHFEYVSAECSRGLQKVAIQNGIPIAFGVLTTDTMEQAEERSLANGRNQGSAAATALIETMNVCERIKSVIRD